MQGTGVSKGLCLAKVMVLKDEEISLSKAPGSVEEETRLFRQAVTYIYEKTKALVGKAEETIGENEAAIFEAHCDILKDSELTAPIEEAIQSGNSAVLAIEETMNYFTGIFEGMENDYMRQRAADIRDIKVQLQRHVLGIETVDLSCLKEPVIIVAKDIAPSVTASMDLEHVAGMVMEGGGPTSHTAILARTMEIPAVVGVHGILEWAKTGDWAAVDGGSGAVVLNPDAAYSARFGERIKEQERCRKRRQTLSKLPCTTADGHHVHLFGNIGTEKDVDRALLCGAEGIGLLRSEFLYLSGDGLPDEEQQYSAYSHVLERMGDAPVIVRTLDIGGDKDVPALNLGKEENPFLGLRAIRLCRARQGLFETQIRALLRASVHGNLQIMFPMISSLEELRWAKAVVNACRKQLAEEGVNVKKDIPVGMMVEIPSTAVMADAFAAECDFFSIGTNDLTQYTLAVDRGNDSVSELSSFYHPAVIRLIKQAIDGAHRNDILCGMCGEAAGDKKMIPLLVGVGLDEFSMSAGILPEAKELLRTLDSTDCTKLAAQVLDAKTAAETEELLGQYLRDKEEGITNDI